jgi:hypothetical protein
MKCLNCNNLFEGRYCKKFCSRSCAAIFNNKAKPKRHRRDRAKCRVCDKEIDYHGVVHCRSCIDKGKHIRGIGPIANQTIEIASRRSGANRYDIIRNHARYTLYKTELANPCCEKCGYTKHTELCHIKSISSFPKNTLVSVVNDRSNIIFLCPNCHWELDHNL